MLRNSVVLIILCSLGYCFSFKFPSNSLSINHCQTPLLKNGQVFMRYWGKFAVYKCNPSYTIYGDRISYCVKGQLKVPFCIKSGCPLLQPTTNASTITLYNNNATALLFCKSGYTMAGSSTALCDGVNWDRILGTCRKVSIGSLTWCDFEPNKLCEWVSLESNDIHWERRNGYTQQTKHLRIGPKQDHTSQHPLDGHYLITQSFQSYRFVAKARLLSPIYLSNLSNQTCIRLYYYKFGNFQDVLKVFLKPISINIDSIFESEKYLLLKKLSHRTDDWTELLFSIKQCSEDFQIIIEATIFSAYTDGIAIDDFEILTKDECYDDIHQTTVVVPRENKLSGVIYDVQSCENRCHETRETHGLTATADEIITEGSGRGGIFEHCDCFIECEDNETCCPDYFVTCILSSTESDTTLESTTEIDFTSEIDTSWESTVEDWVTTEEQDTELTTLPTKRYPIRFRNRSTTMTNRISTTRRYPTRSKTRPTYSPRNIINKPLTTTAVVPVKLIDISNSNSKNDMIKTTNTSFITIFIAVGLILVSTLIVLILYKRYRTNGRDELSDVQFLIANEEVKFTPTD